MELQLYSCFKSKSQISSLWLLWLGRALTHGERLFSSLKIKIRHHHQQDLKYAQSYCEHHIKNPPPNSHIILRIFSDFLIFSPVLLSRSAVVWLLLSVCGVWAQRRECVVTRARARSCTGQPPAPVWSDPATQSHPTAKWHRNKENRYFEPLLLVR